MLPEIDLKLPDRIAATLVWIFDAYDSEEIVRILTPSGQPNRYTHITWLLNLLAYVNVCFRQKQRLVNNP